VAILSGSISKFRTQQQATQSNLIYSTLVRQIVCLIKVCWSRCTLRRERRNSKLGGQRRALKSSTFGTESRNEICRTTALWLSPTHLSMIKTQSYLHTVCRILIQISGETWLMYVWGPMYRGGSSVRLLLARTVRFWPSLTEAVVMKKRWRW
jgi:hypothetical protein